MKTILVIAALLGVAACAEGGGGYGLEHGPASYDALKAATEKCQSDGGHIVLKSGYDNRELSNYECRMGGAH
jgi:predicted kinase